MTQAGWEAPLARATKASMTVFNRRVSYRRIVVACSGCGIAQTSTSTTVRASNSEAVPADLLLVGSVVLTDNILVEEQADYQMYETKTCTFIGSRAGHLFGIVARERSRDNHHCTQAAACDMYSPGYRPRLRESRPPFLSFEVRGWRSFSTKSPTPRK